MKYTVTCLCFVLWAFLTNCTHKTEKGHTILSPKAFADKIQTSAEATIIDVRTPEEFANGHLPEAQNVDWNGADFMGQLASLDKSKPLFVYCLSGGRSASASSKLLEEGFQEVYELEGGMMAWRNEHLPESNQANTSARSLSDATFADIIAKNAVVLVDVYAEWCGPCKRMKPFIDEITQEKAGKVLVLRIDADANPDLCQNLKIEALPTLLIYKDKKLVWSHVGYLEKAELLAALNQ